MTFIVLVNLYLLKTYRINKNSSAMLVSGYRLNGKTFLDEKFPINGTTSGTRFHSLRLVIDNDSSKSAKVFVDKKLFGSIQEHFVSRLKGGVFVLNHCKGVALFRNFVLKECKKFDDDGKCTSYGTIHRIEIIKTLAYYFRICI